MFLPNPTFLCALFYILLKYFTTPALSQVSPADRDLSLSLSLSLSFTSLLPLSLVRLTSRRLSDPPPNSVFYVST